MIGNLLCRDISYYKTNLIYKVFATERPDAVVILTTRTFIDRSVILATRALGIPSFYLMHGAINVGDRHEGHYDGMHATLLKQRWERALKYLLLVLPNYFYAGTQLTKTFPFRAYPYQIIWKTFSNPAEYYWAPPPHPELHCNWALVWAEAYAKQIQKLPGYPPDRVKVVGPPPLDAAATLLNHPPIRERMREFREGNRLSLDMPLVVYLETPGVESGFRGWTRESRLAHFDEIIDAVWSTGRQLVIKLHPASEQESLRKYEADPRVCFLREVNLPMLVYEAQAVIGFVSTTLDIPILLGKPIITPEWGISASLPRDFIERNLAYPVANVQELTRALTGPQDTLFNATALAEYLAGFITLTDGRSVERICDALCNPSHTRSST
jgi:hypothetical protein